MQGNCDELQTALRQKLRMWNSIGNPGWGNVLCFCSARADAVIDATGIHYRFSAARGYGLPHDRIGL